ncbi:hypothetical protein LXA43DRAFT_1062877 [Ganoderma leucocontextum]|nr:hypothetical protein LXA43DRAFT_1062877 [Ganoderma leucocontextum]
MKRCGRKGEMEDKYEPAPSDLRRVGARVRMVPGEEIVVREVQTDMGNGREKRQKKLSEGKSGNSGEGGKLGKGGKPGKGGKGGKGGKPGKPDEGGKDKKGAKGPRPRISFAIEVARKMWEDASEEEKQTVEQFRAKLSIEHPGLELFAEGELDTNADMDAQQLRKCAVDSQNAITGLPKVLQNVLDEIEKKTGWVGTIIVGGPAPDTEKLMAMILASWHFDSDLRTHQGRTLNLGYNFAEATNKWRLVEEVFDKFLASCYSQTARKKLTDAYHTTQTRDSQPASRSAIPPFNQSNTTTGNSPNTSESPTEPSIPMRLRDVTDESTATRKKGKAREPAEMSYDDFMAAQRANAQAHLAALGAKQAAAAMNRKEPKKHGPRAKKGDTPTQKPPSARPQTHSATAVANTLSTAPPPGVASPPAQQPPTATTQSNVAPPLSGVSLPTEVLPPSVSAQALSSSISVQPPPLSTLSLSVSVQPPPPSISAQPPLPSISVQAPSLSISAHPPSIPSSVADVDVQPADPVRDAMAPSTELDSESPPPLSDNAGMQDDFGTIFTAIDKHAPSYVTDTLEYFLLIDERGYPGGQKPDQRLTTKLHPPEIRQWMQVGWSYENLPCITPKTFGPEWKAW